MKILQRWSDLVPYGINCLTGEACAYSIRLLCDLNEDGVKLLNDFYGGNIKFSEKSNWNQKVNNKPAVASIMLTDGVMVDLFKFILFSENYPYVRESKRFSSVSGLKLDEIPDRAGYSTSSIFNYLRNPAYDDGSGEDKGVRVGSRNIHQMTGRVT